ncbi:hypothetical protein J4228_01725 [Candidatus Woesearchaeota archaeon]|nr:hypothetical protein [Candidatus Woesearchaeota archaeon]
MGKEEDLHPEERIKKLKESQEKSKKEIEEAQKKIKESEDEITERRKWLEKVPIPELAQEELEGLSEEARVILKQQKGLRERKGVEEPAAKGAAKREERSLEETVEEFPDQSPRIKDVHYQLPSENAFQMSYNPFTEKPLGELYQDAFSLQHSIEEKGYMNLQDQQRAMAMYNSIDERLRAHEEGTYSMNEEVAQRALLAKQTTGRLLDNVYQSNKSTSVQKDWYKGM